MKVMLLCAGRGERMRPLTATIPKALIKIQGEPLVVHMLKSLKKSGFRECVINVSHMGEQIIQTLGDGSAFDMHIEYSIEESPLETAGGVIKALPLLGQEPILIVSGDLYTEFDFTILRDKPLAGMLAHCVMVNNPPYHPEGDFHLGADHHLALTGDTTLTYGNIGVYDLAMFAERPVEKIGIGALLRAAIGKHQVTGELFTGAWHNLGTPEDLMHLTRMLSEKTA
jgi:MurNAc alpha-1-phosphate uridylyltransferase